MAGLSVIVAGIVVGITEKENRISPSYGRFKYYDDIAEFLSLGCSVKQRPDMSDVLCKLRELFKTIIDNLPEFLVTVTGILIFVVIVNLNEDYVWPYLAAGLTRNWFIGILSALGIAVWYAVIYVILCLAYSLCSIDFLFNISKAFGRLLAAIWGSKESKPAENHLTKMRP